MRANSANAPVREGAGFGSTASLVGFRLFQALGWRIGAGVLLLTACPLAGAGGYLLSLTDRCAGAGTRMFCASYGSERMLGAGVVVLAILVLLAAVGLWKRGGAVRDVEILSEQVEGVA